MSLSLLHTLSDCSHGIKLAGGYGPLNENVFSSTSIWVYEPYFNFSGVKGGGAKTDFHFFHSWILRC